MSFQGKTIALIASWNLQCILNARWNFSLSWSCISNKKFQRVKATVSKRIYPKCGVREKRISHQFFRFNFIISLGTINLTYFRHVWNLNLYVYIYIYIFPFFAETTTQRKYRERLKRADQHRQAWINDIPARKRSIRWYQLQLWYHSICTSLRN